MVGRRKFQTKLERGDRRAMERPCWFPFKNEMSTEGWPKVVVQAKTVHSMHTGTRGCHKSVPRAAGREKGLSAHAW